MSTIPFSVIWYTIVHHLLADYHPIKGDEDLGRLGYLDCVFILWFRRRADIIYWFLRSRQQCPIHLSIRNLLIEAGLLSSWIVTIAMEPPSTTSNAHVWLHLWPSNREHVGYMLAITTPSLSLIFLDSILPSFSQKSLDFGRRPGLTQRAHGGKDFSYISYSRWSFPGDSRETIGISRGKHGKTWGLIRHRIIVGPFFGNHGVGN